MDSKNRPTKDQIEAWKKEYGEVFHAEFEDSKECYIRKPDRKQAKLIISKGRVNVLNGVEALIANCWLAGDEEVKTDTGKYHVTLLNLTDEILEVKKGEIKKL